jgi:hypothetical protein
MQLQILNNDETFWKLRDTALQTANAPLVLSLLTRGVHACTFLALDKKVSFLHAFPKNNLDLDSVSIFRSRPRSLGVRVGV